MKNLVVGLVALAVVVASAVVYMMNTSGTDAPDVANRDTAAVYEYCTSYGASEAHCTCSVEQAKTVFLTHDWDAIRILHRDGLETMQAHMAGNFNPDELTNFVERMSEMDALSLANCPPA